MVEPELKRRRTMEKHEGGDEVTSGSTQVSGVIASKTILKPPSGSPSGDFGTPGTHEYLSLISDESPDGTSTPNVDIHRQSCEYGDAWGSKYPLPLSNFPQRPIRTGNMFYDGIIVDLELLGYKPLQVIAKGRSGTVILAQNLHTMQRYREFETVPIVLKLNSGKTRRCRSPSKTDMTDEMSIHQRLHHRNIVTWLDNISYKGRLGTVMEFCESGTLEQLIKLQDARFLTEPVARRYYRQIVSAVHYLHLQGFAHRDLCLQNILITQHDIPKLSDFGHAVSFHGNSHLCTDECGSSGYQPPEMLEKVPYNPKMADVWTLGALLYTMCIGRLPLGCIRETILERASKEIRFPEERVLPVSKGLKSLIRGQMTYIPGARFSLTRINQSEWACKVDKKAQIGNFFKVRQPQKTEAGQLEARVKDKLQI